MITSNKNNNDKGGDNMMRTNGSFIWKKILFEFLLIGSV